MKVGELKRYFAGFLAAVTLLTSTDIVYAAEAVQANKTYWTSNAAEVVSEYYGLTDAETTIVTNDNIASGEEYNVQTPANESAEKLISVDVEAKKIAAEKYGDWVPVTAEIKVNGETKETVTLTDGEAVFAFDGNSYSVAVNYQLDVTIDAAEQERILGIPTVLMESFEDLETLKSIQKNLATVQSNVETMNTYKDMIADKEEDTAAAIDALYADYSDDSTLQLYAYAQAYRELGNGSKIDHLFKWGASIRKCAKTTYDYLVVLYESEAFAKAIDKAEQYNEVLYKALNNVYDAVEALVADGDAANLYTLASDEKAFNMAISTTFDLNGAYVYDAALETAISSLVENGVTEVGAIDETITAATYTVNRNVDAYDVTVVISAKVSDGLANSNATVDLESVTATITLGKNTSREDVLTAIGDLGLEAVALEAWTDYEVAMGQYFFRSETELAEGFTLTEDLTYTISYVPTMYTISTDYAGEKEYPYNSKIALPVHTDANKSYDYVVEVQDAKEYFDQGAVFTVTQDMNITRTEGTSKEEKTLLSLLTDDSYGFSEEAKAILNSEALVSPVVKFRYPGDTAVSEVMQDDIAVKEYYITAGNVDSGVAGMFWIPEAAVVMNMVKEGEENVEVVVKEVPFTAVQSLADASSTNYVAEWAVEDFSHVNVKYALAITQVSDGAAYEELADASQYANLPHVLVTEVTAQNNMLKEGGAIRSIYDNLKSKDDPNASILSTTIMDMLASSLESQAAKDAVAVIQTDVTEGGGWNYNSSEIAVFSYLRRLMDDEWSVASYYKNKYYNDIKAQAELLAYAEEGQMSRLQAIVEDTGFNSFLEEAVEAGLLAQDMADELKGSLETLNDDLNKLISKIAGPNPAMNTNSKQFGTLINAILAAEGKTSEVTAEAVSAYKSFTKNAPNRGSFVVKVQVGNAVKEISIPFELDGDEEETFHVLTADDLAAINAAVEAFKKELGVTAETEGYYVVTDSVAAPEVGAQVNGYINTSVSMAPRTYTVTMEGVSEEDYKETFVYGEDYTISLPVYSENANSPYYYRYTIGNAVKNVENGTAAGSYTFKNIAEVAAVFGEDDALVISKVIIQKNLEKIQAFVDALNKAFVDAGLGDVVSVVPVMHANDKAANDIFESIVLKMNATAQIEMSSIVSAVSNVFMNLNYPYVGFGENDTEADSQYAFRYNDNGLKLNPQALVNMILAGGPTTESVLAMVDADGNVINNVPVGEGSYPAIDTALGGVLVETNIHLGNSAAAGDFDSIPMYITVTGDQAEMLSQVRNLMDKIKNNVRFNMSDGKVALSGTIPEKAYNIYLSVMILMGELDLDDINAEANLKDQVKFCIDMLRPVLQNPETDYQTFENTVKELGWDVEFDEYANIINKLINSVRNMLNNHGAAPAAEGDAAETGATYGVNPQIKDMIWTDYSCSFTVVYDAAAVLDKVEGIDIIKENLATTTFEIPVEIKIFNFRDEYEAIMLDVRADGITNKLSYVKDGELVDALANASGEALVILLKDITLEEGEVLTVNDITALNLNGKVITGDIKANAALRIVDSALDATDAVGGVDGTITGNVRVSSGWYTQVLDASVLRDTYVQNFAEGDTKGYVTSKYFTINENVTTDELGNVTDSEVVVELSPAFAEIASSNVQMLVLELAADVLFDVYSNAAVNVNGYDIYKVDIDNILANLDSLGNIASDVVESVNEEGVTWFINELFTKLTDLDALADVLESEDLIFASYELTTAPWQIRTEVTEDNRIDVKIGSGDAATRTITLKFMESDAELANAFREMNKLITIENDFELESISYEGQFDIKGTAKLDVTVDLEGDETGKASDYVTALAVMLAYYGPVEEREAFVRDILYYEHNIYAGNLRDRIDAMSIRQLLDTLAAAKANEDLGEEKVTFEAMLEELGLRNVLYDGMAIEACYRPLLQATYAIAGTVNRILGDRGEQYLAKALGGVKDPNGIYGGDVNPTGNVRFAAWLKMFAPDYVDPTQHVYDLIEKIPADIADNYAAREAAIAIIDEARAAYDALSDLEKSLVRNYYKLLAAEAEYDSFGVWVAEIDDQLYTGSSIKPEVRVYFGATRLVKGKEYTVSYANNKNAADADSAQAPRAVISLKKNYTGKVYAYFTILPIDLSLGAEYLESVGVTISKVSNVASKSKTYGKPVIKINGKTVSSSQYTLGYPQKDEAGAYQAAGTYTITITGKNKNFIGECTAKQYVATAKISAASLQQKVPAQEYKGTPITLDQNTLVLKYKGTTLVQGVHYDIVGYEKNDRVGTAKVIVEGKGAEFADANGLSFIGTKKINFTIVASEKLTGSMVKILTKGETYTGSAIKLVAGEDYEVKTKAGVALTEGVDFEVTYKNNLKKGTATAIFTGKGIYSGAVKKEFKINAAELSEDMIMSKREITVDYQKGGVKPASEIVLEYNGVTLVQGKDYTISWYNVNKAGSASSEALDKKAPYFKLTGKGNYTGSIYDNFTIEKADLAEVTMVAKDVVLANKNHNYKTTVVLNDVNGKKLSSSSDYSKDFTYYIATGIDAQGNPIFTEISASGKIDKDGKVIFAEGETEHLMKVEVTARTGAKCYYEGTVSDTYRICNINISKAKITVNDKASIIYKKTAWIPDLTVTIGSGANMKTLVKDVDYKVTASSYNENILVGTAKVTIEGIGVYGGTKTATFRILKFNQKAATITTDFLAASSKNIVVDFVKGGAKPADQIVLTYTEPTGKVVTLVEGRDYTVAWYNYSKIAAPNAAIVAAKGYDKNAPYFKITGKNNFKGSIKVNYTIETAELNEDTVITVKDVVWTDKTNNFKTKVTISDKSSGKRLSSSTDYSNVFTYYVYDSAKGAFVEVAKNAKVEIPAGETEVLMKVVVSEKAGAKYTGSTEATYRLYKK